jgi:hypothetical protein
MYDVKFWCQFFYALLAIYCGTACCIYIYAALLSLVILIIESNVVCGLSLSYAYVFLLYVCVRVFVYHILLENKLHNFYNLMIL